MHHASRSWSKYSHLSLAVNVVLASVSMASARNELNLRQSKHFHCSSECWKSHFLWLNFQTFAGERAPGYTWILVCSSPPPYLKLSSAPGMWVSSLSKTACCHIVRTLSCGPCGLWLYSEDTLCVVHVELGPGKVLTPFISSKGSISHWFYI